MIKNIVFDMGNVLIRFVPEQFVDRLDLESDDRKIILEQVFRSEEWTHLDDGTLLETEFDSLLQEKLPGHLLEAARRMIFAWDEPLLIIPGMEELIAGLKAEGFGIYLLSNASARQHEYWERIPASRYFDGTLISADVKMVKPDPGIYRKLFETFQLDPSECLFVDDSAANIDGGKALGMDGFLFTGDAKLLSEWLKEYKVK